MTMTSAATAVPAQREPQLAGQIAAAQARSGPGDLGALLAGSDTWEVS